MDLLPKYKNILKKELSWWHEAYLPVKEKVLDVGAGCGETAQFYFMHGAKLVICIEGDPGPLSRLYLNFGRDPRVVIIPTFVDSVKIDIEGSEEGLVYETHYPTELRVWKNVDPGNPTAKCFRLEKRPLKPKQSVEKSPF